MLKRIILLTIGILFFALNNCGGEFPQFSPLMERTNNADSTDLPGEEITFRFISVGQGDTTLIITPEKNAILIDAGPEGTGRELILPIIEELGVDLILIVASHYDLDHIGGIPEILKGSDGIIETEDDIVPAYGILDRGKTFEIEQPHLLNYFILAGEMRFSLEPGSIINIDGLDLTVLAENGEFSDGSYIELDPENENAHSISLLITYGNIKYLTSGDLPGPNFENQYEPYDLESYIAGIVGDIDILHVSHHGSHNSTAPEFLEVVKPEVAVISVGANTYGHPHEVVLENLRNTGSKIYLTEGDWIEDKEGLSIANGDICLSTDGTSMNVDICD